jgi:hypothetical protein
MSWHGPARKGATRERREQKRREAAERQARAEAREVVDAWVAKRGESLVRTGN